MSFIVLILWKLKVNEIQNLFSVSLFRQKKKTYMFVTATQDRYSGREWKYILNLSNLTTNIDILSQFFMNFHSDKNLSRAKLV